VPAAPAEILARVSSSPLRDPKKKVREGIERTEEERGEEEKFVAAG
jgi:hypothetical protein